MLAVTGGQQRATKKPHQSFAGVVFFTDSFYRLTVFLATALGFGLAFLAVVTIIITVCLA